MKLYHAVNACGGTSSVIFTSTDREKVEQLINKVNSERNAAKYVHFELEISVLDDPQRSYLFYAEDGKLDEDAEIVSKHDETKYQGEVDFCTVCYRVNTTSYDKALAIVKEYLGESNACLG